MVNVFFKAKRLDNGQWVTGFFTKKQVGGLFVPVINNIESKSADILRSELNTLREQINIQGCTTGLQHPTFILSNFGKFAGRYATPVIVPPTVAILAVGKARDSIVIIEGSPVVKKCVPLSLSFDHRAVTGGQAARFLQAILQFFNNKHANYFLI